MATYRYSKLKNKSGKNTQKPPETLSRQTAHPFFMDSTYLQDSQMMDESDDASSSTMMDNSSLNLRSLAHA